MRGSDRDLWSGADWGTGVVLRTEALPLAGKLLEAIRACCTPTNLAALAVVAAGWFALLGWSGAGPDGWQARLCAGLDEQPRACSTVRLHKDESRIAPHTAGTGADS